ncbi:hypothetical protein Q8F55_003741 [Vanrija albida]|uniref:Proteophosphoglycan ppg4 n=1 Tax=Vanrija albida TaxID=181172 RepID=A0ABR3Q4T5_9TREE
MPPSPRSLSPISLSPITGLHPYQPLYIDPTDSAPPSPQLAKRLSAPPELDPAFLLRTPPSPARSNTSLKGSRRRKRQTMPADLAAVADLTDKLMGVADGSPKPRSPRSPPPRVRPKLPMPRPAQSPTPASPTSPHPHVDEGERAPFRPGSRAPSRAASVASSSPATRPRSRPSSMVGPPATPGTPSRPPSRAASRAGSRTGSIGRAGMKRHSRTRSLAEEIADAESKLPFYDSDEGEEKKRGGAKHWVEALRDGPTSPTPSKVPVVRRSSVGSAAGSAASGASRGPPRAHVRRESVEYTGGRVSRESARHSSGSQSPAPGSPSSSRIPMPKRIPSLKRNDTVQSMQSMQSFKSAKSQPMRAPTPTQVQSTSPSRRLATPASPKPMAKKIGPPAPLKPTPPTAAPAVKSPPPTAAKKNKAKAKEPSKDEEKKVRTPSTSMSRSVIKALKPKGSLRKAALSPGGSPEPAPPLVTRQRSNSSVSKGTGAFASLAATSNAVMLAPSPSPPPKKVSPASSIASLKSFASSLSHRSSKGERSALVESLSEDKGSPARAPLSPAMEQKATLAPPPSHPAPEPEAEGDLDASPLEGSLARSKSGRNMFSRLRTLSFTPKPATITPKASKGSRPPSVVDVFAPSGDKKPASTSSHREEAAGASTEPTVAIQVEPVEPPVVFEPVQDAVDDVEAPEPDAIGATDADALDPIAITTPEIILSPPRSPVDILSPPRSPASDASGTGSELAMDDELLLDSDDELCPRPGEGLLSDSASIEADPEENDGSPSGSESPGLTWSTGESLEIVPSEGSLESLSSAGSDKPGDEDLSRAMAEGKGVELGQPGIEQTAGPPAQDPEPQVHFPVPVPFAPATAVDPIPEDAEPEVAFPVPVPFAPAKDKPRPATPVVPPPPSQAVAPPQFSAEPEAPASEAVWWAAPQPPSRPTTPAQAEPAPTCPEPTAEWEPLEAEDDELESNADAEEDHRRARSAAPSPEPSPEHRAAPLPTDEPEYTLSQVPEAPAPEPIPPAVPSNRYPTPPSEPEDLALAGDSAPLAPRQQLPPGQFVALSPCLVAFAGTSFTHSRSASTPFGGMAALIGLPGLGVLSGECDDDDEDP